MKAIIAKKRQEEHIKVSKLKKKSKQALETISETQGSLKENSDSEISLEQSTSESLPQFLITVLPNCYLSDVGATASQEPRKPQSFPWKRISDSVP